MLLPSHNLSFSLCKSKIHFRDNVYFWLEVVVA